MIENVNLFENPFLFILVLAVLVGTAIWLVHMFDVLRNSHLILDARKLFKERHDASYSPLEKLHLMEVKK